MGWACGMYGENRNIYRVWWVSLKERYVSVDGRMILKMVLKWNGRA
jgi:hypothetical protein